MSQPENSTVGAPAEVHMTVQITRKATGAVETYELAGRVSQQPPVPQHPFQPQLPFEGPCP